jgi:hypothetical protein
MSSGSPNTNLLGKKLLNSLNSKSTANNSTIIRETSAKTSSTPVTIEKIARVDPQLSSPTPEKAAENSRMNVEKREEAKVMMNNSMKVETLGKRVDLSSFLKPMPIKDTSISSKEASSAPTPPSVVSADTTTTTSTATDSSLKSAILVDRKLLESFSMMSKLASDSSVSSTVRDVLPPPPLLETPSIIEVTVSPTTTAVEEAIVEEKKKVAYSAAELRNLKPKYLGYPTKRIQDLYGRVVQNKLRELYPHQFPSRSSATTETAKAERGYDEPPSIDSSNPSAEVESEKRVVTNKPLSFEEQKRIVEEERLKYLSMSRKQRNPTSADEINLSYGSFHQEADNLMKELQHSNVDAEILPPASQNTIDFDIFADPLDSLSIQPLGIHGSSSNTSKSRFESIFESSSPSNVAMAPPLALTDQPIALTDSPTLFHESNSFLSSYLPTLDTFLDSLSVPLTMDGTPNLVNDWKTEGQVGFETMNASIYQSLSQSKLVSMESSSSVESTDVLSKLGFIASTTASDISSPANTSAVSTTTFRSPQALPVSSTSITTSTTKKSAGPAISVQSKLQLQRLQQQKKAGSQALFMSPEKGSSIVLGKEKTPAGKATAADVKALLFK